MKRIILTGTLVAIVAILAGGVWALRKPAEASEREKPITVATVAAPDIKLAAGENENVAARRTWKAPDGSVITLALVERGESPDQEVIVRAFSKTGVVDVTKPLGLGDTDNELRVTKTGLVLFQTDLAARVEGVGALMDYTITRIEWVPEKKQLAVTGDWSCDETEHTSTYCDFPAWAEEMTK